KTYPYPGHSQH
ncbi:hypothetical protein ECEC1856_2822, partial [Escherichia coli EC1856]